MLGILCEQFLVDAANLEILRFPRFPRSDRFEVRFILRLPLAEALRGKSIIGYV